MSKLYTAEYIYQYVKGELSNEDAYQLEKAALSDPFLSDMISGYEVAFKKFGNQKVQEYLQTIKNSATPAPKVIFKNKKNLLIAAGVVTVLIILGIAGWNQLNTNIDVSPQNIGSGNKSANTQPLVDEALLENYSLDIYLSDDQNQPLVQKAVTIYNQSYTTDETGKINIRPLKAGTNFNIDIDDYQPQQISIPKSYQDVVYIQLTPAVGEQEAVVLSKDKLYAPEGGWFKFQNYVQANKQLPSKNLFAKGSVIVKASLSSNNVLSGFEIVQSVNPLYDTEAIRLIKSYDAWKNKMSAPIVVYLEVNF